jgi:hypothetical protein
MWYHVPIVFALSVASASVNYSPGEILVDAISKQSSAIPKFIERQEEVAKLNGRLIADFGAATALDASNMRGSKTKQNASKAAATSVPNQSIEDLRAALLAELSYIGNRVITLDGLSNDIAACSEREIIKSSDALNVLTISQSLYKLVLTRDAEADHVLQKDIRDHIAEQVRHWIAARKLADQLAKVTTTDSPESSTSAPQDTTPSAEETTEQNQTQIMSEPSVENLEEILDYFEHIGRGDYDELYAPYEEITDKELDEAFQYLFPGIDLSELSSTFDFCDGVDESGK